MGPRALAFLPITALRPESETFIELTGLILWREQQNMTADNGSVQRLEANLAAVIHGKAESIRHLIVALLAGGHVLIEDVPGVGKTTLAKALAASLSATFKRIQFTPDLLPADIIGGSVLHPQDGSFHFREGPVFTNILLADEINRASPRTQSSLLEAMNEGQVTVEGKLHPMPQPFVVVATQNPVEFHGTYPLPEAQLDRFALKIQLGYPDLETELGILDSQSDHSPLLDLTAVMTCEEIMALRGEVRAVKVQRPVGQYIVELANATRHEPRLALGASPRGALHLYRAAQARAFLEGRDYGLPDDVKALAVPVLAHRLILDTKARYAGTTKEQAMAEILEQVRVPT